MAYAPSTYTVKIVPEFDHHAFRQSMRNIRWAVLGFEVGQKNRMAAKRIASLAKEYGALLD